MNESKDKVIDEVNKKSFDEKGDVDVQQPKDKDIEAEI